MRDETTVTADEPATDRAASTGVREKLRAIGVAIGLLIAALAASIAVGVVVTVPLFLSGADLMNPDPVIFLGLAAVGQLAFLAVGGAYVWRGGGVPVRVRVPTRRDLAYVGGGLVGALGLVLTISAVAAAVGLGPEGSVFDDPIARNRTIALALAVLSLVLIAPAEELLFRGAIQGRLRRSFGPVGAVLGASLIFGSLHFANFTGSVVGGLVGIAVVTVGGVVFGTIYERTRNLVVPILTHGLYNTVLLIAAFLTA